MKLNLKKTDAVQADAALRLPDRINLRKRGRLLASVVGVFAIGASGGCFSGASDIFSSEKSKNDAASVEVELQPASGVEGAPSIFDAEIMPMFEASCVSCHGPKKQEAGFRLDSYENMMKAGDSGIVFVTPGQPEESMLIDLVLGEDPFIEQMPSESKKLTPEQVDQLRNWIAEGAEGPAPKVYTVDFATQIEPILQENCSSCHAGNSPESGMSVLSRASMLKGGDSGHPSIISGDPVGSALIQRVKSDEADFRMPREGNPLTDEQIKLLTTWISEGANWPGQMNATEYEVTTDLWSMQPIERPDVPAIEGASPIDAFIIEALQEKELSPVGAAEPQTLARRASLVLTGLPPKASRVSEFIDEWNKDPDVAYSTYLDELFASKHFGERWAQHWIDVIRWSESNGSEANEFRKNAWQYRDYLINAFNDDKPYDLFLKEQMAGDVLGVDIATGFLVAGPHVPDQTVGQEASAIRQARYDRLDEIVQTVSSGVMGMTVTCARCHSHKFDPISIKDYYAMAAIFQDIEYDSRLPNLPDTDPRMQAEKRLDGQINEIREFLAEKAGDWREEWTDHVKVHFGDVVETDTVRVRFPGGNEMNEFTFDEIAFFDDYSSLDNLAITHTPKVTESRKRGKNGRPPSNLVNGIYTRMNGWGHNKGDSDGEPWLLFEFEDEISLERMEFSRSRWDYYGTDFMLNKNSPYAPEPVPYLIEVMDENGDWKEVANWAPDSEIDVEKELLKKVKDLSLKREKEGRQMMFMGQLIEPAVSHVLYRGSPETPREEVMPRGFEVLKADFGLDSNSSGPERRMAMAEWLVAPENPLTSRVMANRLWSLVFGEGIVNSPGDFGFAGGTPSHPELLDWLASEFVEDGWSMKTILRKMVETDAFKRSSNPAPHEFKEDASNMYLWRFAPRWAEGEIIRDSMLASAGILNDQLGGESFRILAPKRRYDQWQVVDNWSEKTWRRTIYQEHIRAVDDNLFTAFDLPGHGQMTHDRPRSTTPLQAFNLLNSDFTLAVSKKLVERAKREAGHDVSDQVKHMFVLVLGRDPSEQDVEELRKLASSDDLMLVARLLYNLNEFRYIQ